MAGAGAFQGRTVVVTGATSGIGGALVDAFGAAGARVVGAARHLPDGPPRDGVLLVRCDVSVVEDCERLVAEAVAAYGGVDVLVNNAGTAQSGLATEEPAGQVRQTFATNVLGPFHLSTLVAQQMAARGGGSIVNVSSLVGIRAMDRYPLASYAASKAALVGLTRELAAQWGRRGIRVNAVAPGWFPTRMTGHLEDADQRAWIEQHTSLGRPGTLEEITGPVLFLAGDASSYVTGQLLSVDGGWL
jgi:NAD(P)-dependent dehydrogenase (short-subunit alcohol dehydrogenase family)